MTKQTPFFLQKKGVFLVAIIGFEDNVSEQVWAAAQRILLLKEPC